MQGGSLSNIAQHVLQRGIEYSILYVPPVTIILPEN